jgi:hypothetical protein
MREAKLGNMEILRCMDSMRVLLRPYPITQAKIDEIFGELRNESSVRDFIESQAVLRRGEEKNLLNLLGKILVVGVVHKERQAIGIGAWAYYPESGEGPWLKAVMAFGEQVRSVEFPPVDCIRHDVIYKVQDSEPKHHGSF